jgi:hypothetical protein
MCDPLGALKRVALRDDAPPRCRDVAETGDMLRDCAHLLKRIGGALIARESIAGLIAIIGLSILIHRRLADPRIRLNSRYWDFAVVALLWLQLTLGLPTVPLSARHWTGLVRDTHLPLRPAGRESRPAWGAVTLCRNSSALCFGSANGIPARAG